MKRVNTKPAPRKKVLVAPRLTRLGTLRDLTRAKIGMVGDSGMGQTMG